MRYCKLFRPTRGALWRIHLTHEKAHKCKHNLTTTTIITIIKPPSPLCLSQRQLVILDAALRSSGRQRMTTTDLAWTVTPPDHLASGPRRTSRAHFGISVDRVAPVNPRKNYAFLCRRPDRGLVDFVRRLWRHELPGPGY